MKKKWIISIVVLLAAVAAVLGFMNRQNSPKDEGLLLQSGGSTAAVSFEKLDQITFEGDLVNGKGEVSHHEYKGVELNALLEAGKVYVAVSADGKMLEGLEGGQGAQLIVFGDSNSKRAVRYLKTIDIR